MNLEKKNQWKSLSDDREIPD